MNAAHAKKVAEIEAAAEAMAQPPITGFDVARDGADMTVTIKTLLDAVQQDPKIIGTLEEIFSLASVFLR